MTPSALYVYPGTEGFKAGFSRRGDLNSPWGLNLGLNTLQNPAEVEENRKRFAGLLEKKELVFLNQVHQDAILETESSGIFDGFDGVITRKKGLVLNILTADCLGILACDPMAGIAGAFHAGWKGSALKIVQKGLEKMFLLGAKPAHTKVLINPGICRNCYEVGPELKSFFSPESFHETGGKLFLDLFFENTRQILETGVDTNSIQAYGECSLESPELYSYRREKEKAGRFTSFIVME